MCSNKGRILKDNIRMTLLIGAGKILGAQATTLLALPQGPALDSSPSYVPNCKSIKDFKNGEEDQTNIIH